MNEDVRRSREKFGALFDDALDVLRRENPIFLPDGFPPDEYAPEVATILPRLAACSSASDVTRVVREELLHWFERSGGALRDARIGEALWALWMARASNAPK